MSDHHSHRPPTGTQQWPTYPPAAPRQRVWPWVLGISVALLLFMVGCSAISAGKAASGSGPVGPQATTTSPTAEGAAPTPATPAAPAGPVTSVGDGTYEVGTDMAAGKCKTPGSAEDAIMGCSYHVPGTASFGYSKGPGVLTVKAGQTLTLAGGCTWTKS